MLRLSYSVGTPAINASVFINTRFLHYDAALIRSTFVQINILENRHEKTFVRYYPYGYCMYYRL